ncbi:MAG: SapC family protein [Alphaproteobacteria bacterium]|nr:SapC family protein [Alphaproteobacteria bacterium]
MVKTTASAAKPEGAQDNAGLPLFFKKPMALDPERHEGAGLLTRENMLFAANTNSVFVNSIEFAECAKFYPIVFSGGDAPMPAVLTGLEQKNYYVDADRAWKKDTYIPAYVRRYPFVLMEVPQQQKFVLCIDEEAEQFRKKPGKDISPLFIGGKPAELALSALEFCRSFQQNYGVTREFCVALKDAGLLAPTRSNAKLSNGREVQLTGFQIIDEGKFSKLSDEKILEFHKKGWLPLVYFVLMSASNWRNLIALASAAEEKSK